MITRNEYMEASRENGPAAHRAYYAQFVTPVITNRVLQGIGVPALLKSTDRHLNDIPLMKWDHLVDHLPVASKMREVGDYLTLGTGVCILKEAARQWIEKNGGAA